MEVREGRERLKKREGGRERKEGERRSKFRVGGERGNARACEEDEKEDRKK